MSNLKAPVVTSLRVTKLAANFVELVWDNSGMGFYYNIQSSSFGGDWVDHGYTPTPSYFQDMLYSNSDYRFRVRCIAPGFTESDWVEIEFTTFETNAYQITHMKELTPANAFIKRKFTDNDNYIDFNDDVIQASLMSEDFIFSPEMSDLTNYSDKIVNDVNFHEVQGYIQSVCNDIDRTMLTEINGVLYLFERFQSNIKVSNDKGQTWYYYKAFTDRVGNPVSRICTYQNSTTTYVLGYNKLFYGRQALDVRWSDDVIRFSSDTVTFSKVGDELGLDFSVELFSEFASLPGDVSKYAEAIAADEDYCYIAAKDHIRRIALKNTPLDTTEGSPTFGERLFDPLVMRVTGNEKVIIKKMDVFNGKLYVLVTGEVSTLYADPTNTENWVESDLRGVYELQPDGSFVRVFGDDLDEIRYIQLTSEMSTNGVELFVSHDNFEFPGTRPVDGGVEYITIPGYNAGYDKPIGTFRLSINETDSTNWALAPQEYYNEAAFCWMARTETRTWITPDNRALVLYPMMTYTLDFENRGPSDPLRITHETWDRGDVTLNLPNITFTGFKQYANGVLIHSTNGEIIAYYEFPYRVRGSASIFWKPENTLMELSLINQTREEPWVPEVDERIKDPDLRPLINKMIPDSYMENDPNFRAFGEAYLQFISDGKTTQYNKLLNLIRNQYPREQDSFAFLFSEVNRRNIYLDAEKREQVVRLFEARKNDFYSTKGIENSYKFLFRLLYNEDVEIEMESKAGMDYDIVVYSDNINEDIVGRTVFTPTGRANVTYIEREYADGKLQWRLTIHNMIGKFMEGQVIKSENSGFTGMIVVGVRGKTLASDNIEYINRGRSYYTMKIKSELPASRYRDDVLRFVHPVGFGFIGITLLTMFVNSGLSMRHTETIMNILKAYRMDAGYPLEQYDRVSRLDVNGDQLFDPITGEPMYITGPNAGEPFIVPVEYDTDESEWMGKLPSERRFKNSPLFDQSAVTMANFRDLVNKRLKDDAGNPRDPDQPTQQKLN